MPLKLEDLPKDFDPIHEKEGKWYFWDENWSLEHGPFQTEDEAWKECKRYAQEVVGILLTDPFVPQEFRFASQAGKMYTWFS